MSLKEKLIDALHEGLGGDGWAHSSPSFDERTYCRDKLTKALTNVLKVLEESKKKT